MVRVRLVGRGRAGLEAMSAHELGTILHILCLTASEKHALRGVPHEPESMFMVGNS